MRINRKTRDRRGGHECSEMWTAGGYGWWTPVSRQVIKKQTVKRKRMLGTKELRQWLLEAQYEQAENDADDQSEANDLYFDWLDERDKDWDDPMDDPHLDCDFEPYDPYDDRCEDAWADRWDDMY